jgi:hypothetical protein
MLKRSLQLCVVLFLLGNSSIAQWGGSTTTTGDVYRNGKVGIGTVTPQENLHVIGAIKVAANTDNGSMGGRLTLTHSGKLTNGIAKDWTIYNMSGTYGNSLQFWAYDDIHCQNGGLCAPRFTIMDHGNVGVGTNAPEAKLHISQGNLKLDQNYEILFADNGQIRSLDNNHRILFRRDENKMELREYGSIVFSPGAATGLETSKIVMLENGSVGIGTTNPGAFKLAVEGGIAARTVKVTNTSFADYVFEPTYKLRPLSSVESYINENKHLPGMPSAKEVEKEGGFEMGNMNVKLLEKVEELTLYVIELKKEIEELKKKSNSASPAK